MVERLPLFFPPTSRWRQSERMNTAIILRSETTEDRVNPRTSYQSLKGFFAPNGRSASPFPLDRTPINGEPEGLLSPMVWIKRTAASLQVTFLSAIHSPKVEIQVNNGSAFSPWSTVDHSFETADKRTNNSAMS